MMPTKEGVEDTKHKAHEAQDGCHDVVVSVDVVAMQTTILRQKRGHLRGQVEGDRRAGHVAVGRP